MRSFFVIVTTQRTGATFFRTCLESHPEIECPGTLFAQVTRLKYFSEDRRNSYYYKYRSRTIGRQIAHLTHRQRVVHGCLDEAYGRPTSASALGFKISYSNLVRYPTIVPWLLDHKIKVIHWRRDNLVKRYVSILTKNARRQAHSTTPVDTVSVYVNTRRLLRDLEKQSRMIENYRAVFQQQEYLELSYETFVSDQQMVAKKCLRFLGVDDHKLLSSSLVKQNPDDLEKIISNYREVINRLKGTRFEQFLAVDR